MVRDLVYNSSGEVIGRIRQVSQMLDFVGGEMHIEFECVAAGVEMIEAFNRVVAGTEKRKYETPAIPRLSTGIGK